MPVGIAIMVVILALGLATFGVAVSFLIKPTEVKLGTLRPLSIATTFASVSGLSAGLATALTNISWQLQGGGKAINAAVLTMGIAESLVAAIVGFSLLTLAWIAVSLGMRKHI